MRLSKMHGAGNDFIIINDMDSLIPDTLIPELARELCDRRRSVGADGLMLIRPPQKGGDYAMLFFNSDGSMGEMCGNGARCIARYGYDHALASSHPMVESTAGLVGAERISETLYRIRLNDPSVLLPHVSVTVGDRAYDCAYVELGDPGIPHAVLLWDSLDFAALPSLRALGSALRYAPVFPRGANVSFVKPLSPGRFMAATFERGVEDFTLACGTGCGSITAALSARGLVSDGKASILMPGGELSVTLEHSDGLVRDIYLTGPTCHVCDLELVDLPASLSFLNKK